MSRVTVRTRVHKFDANGEIRARADKLAGEEPLEIRLNGEEFTVMMRTPGNDTAHVLGLLLGEGIITHAQDVREIDFSTGLDPDGSRNYNVARVTLAPVASERMAAGGLSQRNVYTSSACGVCGTSALEGVEKVSAYPLPVAGTGTMFTPAVLVELPDALSEQQKAFDATGGIHAAALFRVRGANIAARETTASPLSAGMAPGTTTASSAVSLPQTDTGHRAADSAVTASSPQASPAPNTTEQDFELLAFAEDVGRHNAVDKVIGQALREGLIPAYDCALQVSSRASYELVQKAAMAGIPVLSAVSAPSSAAVELGKRLDLTVIGFNRKGTFNAYSGLGRITGTHAD